MAFKMPHPTTIIVAVVISLASIWLANNVNAIAKIVGPRPTK